MLSPKYKSPEVGFEQLPNKAFQKCVNRYRGDHYVKKFSCWDQFLSMAAAQLTYRDGVRDIESRLQSVGSSSITWVHQDQAVYIGRRQ